MYTFVFDKRSLALLLAGAVVIAISLAAGGYLLGVRSAERPPVARTVALPAPVPATTTPLTSEEPPPVSIQELATPEPTIARPAVQ